MKCDHEGAARERDQASAVAPADALDFFLIGRELAGKGHRETAIASLEAATHKQPDHFWAQCLLAISRIQNQQSSEALVGLNACLRQRPECAWLYLLSGIANANEGRLARDQVERFAGLAAPLPAAASEKFDAAEEDYRKALEFLGDSPTSGDLRYVLLQNRGNIRIERGNVSGAATDLQAAIHQNERRYEAYVGLAHVYRLQGKTDLALEQIARAIRIQPNRSSLHAREPTCCSDLQATVPTCRGRPPGPRGRPRRSLCEATQRCSARAGACNGVRCARQSRLRPQQDQTGSPFARVKPRSRSAWRVRCSAGSLAGPALAHQLRIQVLLDLKQYDNLLHSCDLALDSVRDPLNSTSCAEWSRIASAITWAQTSYTLSLSLKPGECPRPSPEGTYLVQDAAQPASSDFDAAAIAADST